MRFARKSLILLILINLILFSVCAAAPIPPLEENDLADVRNFFPTTVGLVGVFEGSGNEYAGFTRTVTYKDGDRVQVTDDNGATSMGKIFRVTADALVQIFATEEFYTDKTLFNEKPNRHQVLLKAPLKVGTLWQDSQEKREIISTNEKIQVPAGFFQNVVKVKITPLLSQPTNEQFEYYAPGTGLILREFISGDYAIISKLKSFSGSTYSTGVTSKKITGVYAESKPDAELEKTIIESLRIPDEYVAQTKYYYNYVDLNVDGTDEIFVVVMGPYTSGTGGNTALHIIQTNQGMKVNQVFTLIQTPIIVSDQVTNGVKELVVRYSGGGATGKYVVLTCRDGHFTTVNEGRTIEGLEEISGKAIISNDILKDMQEGKVLFLRKK